MKIIQDFLDKIENNISKTQTNLDEIKKIRKQYNETFKNAI